MKKYFLILFFLGCIAFPGALTSLADAAGGSHSELALVSQTESVETETGAVTHESANTEHNESEGEEHADHGIFALTFLWIAIIVFLAKISGLIERWGQPAVLGELLIGVILGNLILVGLDVFEPMKTNTFIQFLSELGVVILLYQVGLESNIKDMKKVGMKALLVATIGVIFPFVMGYFAAMWLLPDIGTNGYLFLGATLTATSVGITARVFKDLGKLNLPEAKIVLGAAVIDDVMGLIILAVVTAIVTTGSASAMAILWITAKALLFLIGAIVIGSKLAPMLGKYLPKINAGHGLKFGMVISFGLLLAYLAAAVGLAPIVGAFAAGLVLDPVHFKYFKDPRIVGDIKDVLVNSKDKELNEKITKVIEKHSESHIEDFLESLGQFLVPIFFVYTGLQVKVETLFNLNVLILALIITLIAFIGKLIAGLGGGKGMHRMLIGWGMAPRGEVGLIFANIGKQIGVINDTVFSIIVIVVILTTLLTPPILTAVMKGMDKKSSEQANA